ncbi:MAG: hypothetical protein HC914_13615 [Chloroflexaceae bacterium]|nr:hypothetical protein [Chloroflexaceae bacterium]
MVPDTNPNNGTGIVLPRTGLTDREQLGATVTALSLGGTAVRAIVNLLLVRGFEITLSNVAASAAGRLRTGTSLNSFLEALGEFKGFLRGLNTKDATKSLDGIINVLTGFNINTTGAIVGIVGIVAAGLVVAGVAAAFIFGDERIQDITTGFLALAFTAGFSVILPVVTAVKNLKSVTTFVRGLFANAAFSGVTASASAIGAIFSAVLSLGLFIYQAVVSGAEAGSPELNALFAQFLAEVILAVLFAVLATTVVGVVLVGLIALVDAILAIVCAFDRNRLPEVDGACFSLNRYAIKVLSSLIYAYNSTVDTDSDDISVSGPIDVDVDPELGFADNSPLAFSYLLTVTARHRAPDAWERASLRGDVIDDLFSPSGLRSTTYRSFLTEGAPIPPEDEILQVSRNQMRSEWGQVRRFDTVSNLDLILLIPASNPIDLYTMQSSSLLEVAGIELEAGLNQRPLLYQNTAYALPAFECWGPLLINFPVCFSRTIDGAYSVEFSPLAFDIFPATFDEFVTFGPSGDGGQQLAWDERFNAEYDSDGDGLIAFARNGIDPNDTTWDADGDGLSDGFELERRTEGINYSPVEADTDGDGLSDAQEYDLSTNPAARDTDRDGLTDAEEVYHQVQVAGAARPRGTWTGGWNVTLRDPARGESRTVVATSDPLLFDTDGDGLSDFAERELANAGLEFHPRSADQPPLEMTVSINDFDGFVAPGTPLRYTTTVSTINGLDMVNLAPAVREDDIPQLLGGQGFTTSAVDLDSEPEQVFELQVPANATAQQLTLGSAVRAHFAVDDQATEISTRNPGGSSPYNSSRPVRRTTILDVGNNGIDNYLIGALTTDNNVTAFGSRSPGDIRLVGRGQNSINIVVERDNASLFNQTGTTSPYGNDERYAQRPAAPGMACNDQNLCMVVWPQFENCAVVQLYRVTIVRAGSDPNGGIEPRIYLQRDISQQRQNTGNNETIWHYALGTSGRSDFRTGEVLTGPAHGLPVTRTFCGVAKLHVEEVDGSFSNTADDQYIGQSNLLTSNTRFSTDLTISGSGHTVRIGHEVQAVRNYNVFGSLVRPDGTIVAFQFALNGSTDTRIFESAPVVAADDTGFLAVWHQFNPNTQQSQIVAQRYNQNALRSGSLITLASKSNVGSERANIAIAAIDGGFRVVWTEDTTPVNGLRQQRLVDRVLTSSGVPFANDQRILTDVTAGDESGQRWPTTRSRSSRC